jgi:hypothetical protein
MPTLSTRTMSDEDTEVEPTSSPRHVPAVAVARAPQADECNESDEDEDDGPAQRKKPRGSTKYVVDGAVFEEDDEFRELMETLDPEEDYPKKPRARETQLEVPEHFWECSLHVVRIDDKATNKKGWKCNYCGFVCKGSFNATKAKAHLAKIRGEDVRTCSASFNSQLTDMFRRQWQKVVDGRSMKQLASSQREEIHNSRLQAGVAKFVTVGNTRNIQKYNKFRQSQSPTGSFASNSTRITASSIPVGNNMLKHNPGTGIQTYLGGNQPSPEGNLNMDYELASTILREGLPFSFIESPHIPRLIKLAKATTNDYKPPTRKKIATDFLDAVYMQQYDTNIGLLQSEAECFGITMYADGATVAKTPFINVLASGAFINNACLEIHDCTPELEEGGTKDSEYISNLMSRHIDEVDPNKEFVDLVIFDGASNMQKAGRLLQEWYPLITCIHGAEHVVSLFFSDVAKHDVGAMFVRLYSKIYVWFGGRHQGLHSQFIKATAAFSKGRKIGLIRPSGTRMAGYWIAWTRVLRLKDAFESLLVSPAFKELKKSQKPPEDLIAILKMTEFWGFLYHFMRAMYGPLRLLRLCDMKDPCMDKILYFVNKTSEILESDKGRFDLWNDLEDNESVLVQTMVRYCWKRVLERDENGNDSDSLEENCVLDEDEDDEERPTCYAPCEDSGEEEESVLKKTEEEKQSFGEHVLNRWDVRKQALRHDYAKAAWLLSPCKEIQEQVKKMIKPQDKEAVNRLLKKFFIGQHLSTAEANSFLGQVEDEFWSEWTAFKTRTGNVFDGRKRMWLSEDIHTNKTHLWHSKFSYVETKWLGKLACRVTSKINGIGNAERNWGKVKYLKSGQRSHVSSAVVSKQATIFGSASSERAATRAKRHEVLMKWEEEDMDSLGLSKFGIDEKSLEDLLQKTEMRVFQCWTEPWEEDCIRSQVPNQEKEARLLRKYGGLEFCDGEDHFTINKRKMSYCKTRKDRGYHALGMRDSFDGNEEDQDKYENYIINDDLYGLIYEFYNENPDPKIRVITRDGDVDEEGRWSNWVPSKPKASGHKRKK